MRPFHDLYFFSRAVKRYLITLSLAFTVLVYLIPLSRHQALAFWFVSNSWFVISPGNTPSIMNYALPKLPALSLSSFSLVENNGFEPLTPCVQSRCSSQLS